MINANVFPTAFYGLQNFIDNINAAANAAAANATVAKNECYYTPRAEYYEIENGFMLEVELPGVKKENLEMQVEKNILTVKATRERKESKFTYERSFRLAEDIDTDNIKVSLENGVLSFTFAKKPQVTARKLEVA